MVAINILRTLYIHDSRRCDRDRNWFTGCAAELASLRATAGLPVFCPADSHELAEIWRVLDGLEYERAALVVPRQGVRPLDRTNLAPASGLARGGYVLAEGRRPNRPAWCRDGGIPDVILMASGSEVHLALAAREQLLDMGISARVVSMPCWELFERRPPQYRDEVLPPSVTVRIAVEHVSVSGWERYLGADGAVVGMHTFTAPVKPTPVRVQFGVTAPRVAQVAHQRLAAVRRKHRWSCSPIEYNHQNGE